jgi:succinate-acetate transporter protein
MADTSVMRIQDTTANPAPLGLFAFGMTTVLLNLHNAGFYDMNMMILAMGIFYGGCAQVIAGCMEWKKNNTFGTVAFTSYGFFWLTLVGIVLLPKTFPEFAGLAPKGNAMPAFLIMWGLFTFGLFIATFRLSRALQIVLGTLTLLFFLLAYGDSLATPNVDFNHFTGYEGIFCGAAACYTGLAQVLNEIYGKTILPLGAIKKV